MNADAIVTHDGDLWRVKAIRILRRVLGKPVCTTAESRDW
jgi:hypothetical protein